MPLDPRRRSAGLTVFLAVTFALGWFVQLQLGQAGAGRPVGDLLAVMTTSAAPALALPLAVAAWVARRNVELQGFGDAGLRWPAWRWLALGAAAGPALVAATVAASLPLVAIDPTLGPLRAALAQAGGPAPHSPAAALAVQAAASLTLYPVFAFGQELGWRGYLLPRLVEELGPWRGALLHGLAWGAWYAPLIAIGGYGYPGHPALGIALFTAFGALLGVALAWLTFASGSILPAALVHGGLMGATVVPPAMLPGLDPAVAGMPWSPAGLAVLGLVVAGLAASGALGRALARGPAALGPSSSPGGPPGPPPP